MNNKHIFNDKFLLFGIERRTQSNTTLHGFVSQTVSILLLAEKQLTFVRQGIIIESNTRC